MTMSRYRNALPQLTGGLFLTDGGIETTLIFHDGLELPDFAAFHLLRTCEGREALLRLLPPYAGDRKAVRHRIDSRERDVAGQRRLGRPTRDTRRPNLPRPTARPSSCSKDPERIRERTDAVSSSADAWARAATATSPARSCLHSRPRTTTGRRSRRSPATSADMICAITMNYVEEAIGISRAAERARYAGRPVVYGRDRRPSSDRADAAVARSNRSTRAPTDIPATT